MIELFNISYIQNQSSSEHKSTHHNTSPNQTNPPSLYTLKIFQKPQHHAHVQPKPLLTVQLQKSTNYQQKIKQSIFQPKDKQSKCQIKIIEGAENKKIKFNSDFWQSKKYTFQLWSSGGSSAQPALQSSSLNQTNAIVSSRQFDFVDKTDNFCTIAAFDHRFKQFVNGFLSFNYTLLDQNSNPINISHQQIQLYIFSIKVLFVSELQPKRAYLTFSQADKLKSSSNSFNLSAIRQQHENLEESANINQQDEEINAKKSKVKKLPLRRVDKGWLYYKDIVDFQVKLKNGNEEMLNSLQIRLNSFDFTDCTSTCIAIYQGNLSIDFSTHNQIKFTQIQLYDPISNLDTQPIAMMQFKYCAQSSNNLKTISEMTSNIFPENAFSPSKFVHNPKMFISNTLVARNDGSPQNPKAKDNLMSRSLIIGQGNRNVLVKSKFHSIFSPNKCVPIGRQQRFFSTKKKLTDQLGYYAHRTLDINQLPKRETYKFCSFGKDTKQCLKDQAFNKVGPGSGRYRLPSVFDKY